jgi:hypothetical protein
MEKLRKAESGELETRRQELDDMAVKAMQSRLLDHAIKWLRPPLSKPRRKSPAKAAGAP